MTKNDLSAIEQWFSEHDTYAFGLFISLMLVIFGSMFAVDAWWDGGSCVNGLNWHADPNRCYPGGKGIDWTALILGAFVPWTAALITILSLPINTLILKIRRRTFEGDKLEPKRLRRLRERETELGLEPWE